jgi:hypothetical protein
MTTKIDTHAVQPGLEILRSVVIPLDITIQSDNLTGHPYIAMQPDGNPTVCVRYHGSGAADDWMIVEGGDDGLDYDDITTIAASVKEIAVQHERAQMCDSEDLLGLASWLESEASLREADDEEEEKEPLYLGASAAKYIERLESNIHSLCKLCGYPSTDRHAIDAILLIENWIDEKRR